MRQTFVCWAILLVRVVFLMNRKKLHSNSITIPWPLDLFSKWYRARYQSVFITCVWAIAKNHLENFVSINAQVRWNAKIREQFSRIDKNARLSFILSRATSETRKEIYHIVGRSFWLMRILWINFINLITCLLLQRLIFI